MFIPFVTIAEGMFWLGLFLAVTTSVTCIISIALFRWAQNYLLDRNPECAMLDALPGLFEFFAKFFTRETTENVCIHFDADFGVIPDRAGITLGDHVYVDFSIDDRCQLENLQTLSHELVHVKQHKDMGFDRFASAYPWLMAFGILRQIEQSTVFGPVGRWL